MSKLLIDEHPLIVLPSLAETIGLSEAIFVQQLHYWLQRKGHEKDGRYWVYNTYASWSRQFPWWNPGSIRRIIARLRQRGIVRVSDRYNASAIDKTLWYTLDYDRLDQLMVSGDDVPGSADGILILEADAYKSVTTSPTGENDSPGVPKVQSMCTQSTDDARVKYSPSVPKARSNNQRLTAETNTEITTEREEDGTCADKPLDISQDSSPHSNGNENLKNALCTILQKDYDLLPQRKQRAVENAVHRLASKQISVEQVLAFPEYWRDGQPLGPAICATTPHLEQVLEFITASIAWKRDRLRDEETFAFELEQSQLLPESIQTARATSPKPASEAVSEEGREWWQQLLVEMQLSLSPAVYGRWLAGTVLLNVSEDVFTVWVPDSDCQEWLGLRLKQKMTKHLHRIVGRECIIEFTRKENNLPP